MVLESYIDDDRMLSHWLLRKIWKGLYSGLTYRANPRGKRQPLQRKTAWATPAMFDRTLSQHLRLGEVASTSRCRSVTINTLARACELFGKDALLRHFTHGPRAFVAPKACALRSFTEGHIRGPLPTLHFKKGEYIIVLTEVSPEHYYGMCIDKSLQCEILGIRVLGRLGVFPKRHVCMTSPITIHYNVKTFLMTINFSYWAFNNYGNYIGFNFDHTVM